jgi:hypothetical protein
LIKRKEPDVSAEEMKRGEDDARAFHKKGVSVWAMHGFVTYQRTRGQAGPYEAGMVKYINEATRMSK